MRDSTAEASVARDLGDGAGGEPLQNRLAQRCDELNDFVNGKTALVAGIKAFPAADPLPPLRCGAQFG